MAEKLRIAFLVDRFGRRFGGAEAYGVNLVEILCQRHEVTVIAHDFDHDLPVREIRVPQQRKVWPSWIRVWHFAWRAKALTRAGFDVIHSHMDGGAGDIQVLHVTPYRHRRLRGKSWWRRLWVWLQLRNLAYLLLEAASVSLRPGRRLVAVSPYLRDQIHGAYGADLPIAVIPPGASPVAVDPAQRERLRSTLGWKAHDKVALLVARNPLRKGLEAALQALDMLPEMFRLAVVGAGPGLDAYLAERFPGLRQRVTLIAATPDVSPYYQAADVYVHPTLGDSFGMAPFEAMAHDLPVIVSSSEYCGFAEYAGHMRDAWILENPRDPAEIARGITELCTNATTRSRLLQHGAALVQSMSWQSVANKFEALYAESIAERRLP